MMFAGRRRGAISGQPIHNIMNADLAQVMEYDGSEARYDPDADKVKSPLAGLGDPA